ncbi:hypothetical protein E4T50_15403 [Aureobasidium sp. EXF-12298]|nr:hypothetical protein E4T50_15403 [Aureobasidium sp. EXF-12298]KAI4751931.1 hypothetical protein E4T51_14866 [Aureobasidium sp. EXF-12344]KAI4769187.1 hypothetical protein E4T52_15765 [Aureobasidium sp. EXF-3400]
MDRTYGVWRSLACSRHSREYPLDRITLWEKRGGLGKAISLSSGYGVGFHKSLALQKVFFLPMQPPLRLFFGDLWEAFLVFEGKVGTWIQRSGVGKPRS